MHPKPTASSALPLCLALVAAALAACEPSPEDSIARLAGDADERQQARQELLLAKDRAVEPILAAMDAEDNAVARAELVDVLLSLMMRVDDDRILRTLDRHLVSDPDPAVRQRIAQQMGAYNRKEALPALFQLLEDEVADVRFQAMQTIGSLGQHLSDAQKETMRRLAPGLRQDPHEGVRFEAMIWAGKAIDEWVYEAQQMTLRAETARAESLYKAIIEYAPQEQQGHYRLARFYYDGGDRERGMRMLREHGMLLDVLRLPEAPVIDGRLDDPVWQRAARVDTFYQLNRDHFAAPPSTLTTRYYIAWTDEALFFGFYAYDAHPDSLLTKTIDRDDTGKIWYDDLAYIYFDPGFDHRFFGSVIVNPKGVDYDSWIPGKEPSEVEWDADSEFAAHVGDDFWSVEYRLNFDGDRVTRPSPGDVWGGNLCRIYRGGRQYAQWVREYRHRRHGGFTYLYGSDNFGIWLFE